MTSSTGVGANTEWTAGNESDVDVSNIMTDPFSVRRIWLPRTSQCNPSRFYEESQWAKTGGRIALAGHRAPFRFDKLELEPLEPSSFPPVPPLGAGGNLLALIDPVRDSRKGQ